MNDVNETPVGKPTQLPDPVEFAKRAHFKKDDLRKGLIALLDTLTMEFDTQLAAEATNYGDDEHDVNHWALFQHPAKAQMTVYTLNQLQSVVAELDRELRLEVFAYLQMARQAHVALSAEVQVAA